MFLVNHNELIRHEHRLAIHGFGALVAFTSPHEAFFLAKLRTEERRLQRKRLGKPSQSSFCAHSVVLSAVILIALIADLTEVPWGDSPDSQTFLQTGRYSHPWPPDSQIISLDF